MSSTASRKRARAKSRAKTRVESPVPPAAQSEVAPAIVPEAPVASDRFWLGATLVLLVGIAARQVWLGAAPFHPDEAIHALFAQGFGTYHYDPVYHGPLLYHLVAGVFGVFGVNNFSARLVPSLLGIGLLLLTLFPLRRFVSDRAAIASAALLAISPSIITYSRHLLHDSLVLFLTLSAVLCFACTLDHPSHSQSGRWARVGVAVCGALFLATKANFFFVFVMLAAFWLAWRLSGYFRLARWLESALPALCFVVLTATAIYFPRDNTFPPLLQASQHKLFQIVAVASCGLLWQWLLSRANAPAERHYKSDWRVANNPYTGLHQIFSSAEFEDRDEAGPRIRWSEAWLTYALAAGAALWLYVFLFGQGSQILAQWSSTHQFPRETFAAGAQSARTALQQMWDYWAGQQKTPRLPGRHDYYVVLALLYEVPILIAAIGGVWHAAKNRSAFSDLLLWWAFTSWAIYAVANEKVPWLLVHICLPLALLGGVWLGQLRLPRAAWVLGLGLGAAFSLRSDWALIFERAGDHAEPILYAQTPDAFRDVTETMLSQTRGNAGVFWMDTERQWPSVWYFRKEGPNVGDSNIDFSKEIDPLLARSGIAKPEDPINVARMNSAGWRTQTVDFLIWPRASWTALQPRRYWLWFRTREALPLAERELPSSQWQTSILAGKGEWSVAKAVVGWRDK